MGGPFFSNQQARDEHRIPLPSDEPAYRIECWNEYAHNGKTVKTCGWPETLGWFLTLIDQWPEVRVKAPKRGSDSILEYVNYGSK